MENEILCNNIYQSALALTGDCGNGGTDDYAERAPYLIAAMCGEAAEADKVIRKANGLAAQPAFNPVCIELCAPFPLCADFAAPAAAYVAAMLVLDENEELSDKLYERYCDLMSGIYSSLPASCESITDIYGF